MADSPSPDAPEPKPQGAPRAKPEARGPAPGPGRPGADDPVKPTKEKDFKVIRSAPLEPQGGAGSPVVPLLVVLALVAVAVGGIVYTRRHAPTTTPTTTTATSAPEGKAAPDFVLEAVSDKEQTSGAQAALDKALEYRAQYPGSPNLEAAIADLQQRLGIVPGETPEARLSRAQVLLGEHKLEEAAEAARQALAESQVDATTAQAHFVLAQCALASNDKLAAQNELQAAEDGGFDATLVGQLRAQLNR